MILLLPFVYIVVDGQGFEAGNAAKEICKKIWSPNAKTTIVLVVPPKLMSREGVARAEKYVRIRAATHYKLSREPTSKIFKNLNNHF